MGYLFPSPLYRSLPLAHSLASLASLDLRVTGSYILAPLNQTRRVTVPDWLFSFLSSRPPLRALAFLHLLT